MSGVHIVRHVFPKARDTDDIYIWEVILSSDLGVLQRSIFCSTTMYNFYPLTRAEQIEKEARQFAHALSEKFGIPLQCSTGNVPEKP